MFFNYYRVCFLIYYILNDLKNSFRYCDIVFICDENLGLFEEMMLFRKEVLNFGFFYKSIFFVSLCMKLIIKL